MDRFEWLVEKCVELGAIRFSPIICARSERRKLRTDRLQRIALSAMKQSLRSRLPEIDAPMTFDAFLEEYKDKDLLLAHCEKGQKRTLNQIPQNNAPVLCIGPEGDFSPEEIEKARAKGASMIDLGNYRLRTETAAVHGCSLLAAALR
jgi:16S rRNA (uracil1498-N3)-methyltransferase